MESDITLPSVNGWYAYRDDDGKLRPVYRDKLGPGDDKPWSYQLRDGNESVWISDEDMAHILSDLDDPHLYRLLLGEEVR